MKKIALVLILLISFILNSHSQNNVFSTIPKCEISCAIEINSNSSIDSLNEYINNEKQRNLSLTISGLNEVQIDSLLNLINNPMLIDRIYLDSCPIKKIPLVFRKFYRIRDLSFYKCDSIESLNGFKSIQPLLVLKFFFCNIPKLPKGIENIRSILSLYIVMNQDYESFDLEESLSKITFRNNLRAFFIYYENLKEIPKSLDKLTLLSHLYLVCNEKVKIQDKLTNLVNLVEYKSNIHAENLFDNKVIENLIYKMNWNRNGDWNPIDTDTEEGLDNLLFGVLGAHIPYYIEHGPFYKKDIILCVKYLGEYAHYYRTDNSVFSDKHIMEYMIKLDSNNFKIEKKFYVKSFLLKSIGFEIDKIAKIRLIQPYNDEVILSFDLKTGEEYIVNLEKYMNSYFNIEFEIDGKKYIRNVEMK